MKQLKNTRYNPALRQLLADLDTALTDWIRTYAGEMCDIADVAESWERIAKGGGTLAYIADLRERIREAK